MAVVPACFMPEVSLLHDGVTTAAHREVTEWRDGGGTGRTRESDNDDDGKDDFGRPKQHYKSLSDFRHTHFVNGSHSQHRKCEVFQSESPGHKMQVLKAEKWDEVRNEGSNKGGSDPAAAAASSSSASSHQSFHFVRKMTCTTTTQSSVSSFINSSQFKEQFNKTLENPFDPFKLTVQRLDHSKQKGKASIGRLGSISSRRPPTRIHNRSNAAAASSGASQQIITVTNGNGTNNNDDDDHNHKDVEEREPATNGTNSSSVVEKSAVFSSKRLMGRMVFSAAVQKELNHQHRLIATEEGSSTGLPAVHNLLLRLRRSRSRSMSTDDLPVEEEPEWKREIKARRSLRLAADSNILSENRRSRGSASSSAATGASASVISPVHSSAASSPSQKLSLPPVSTSSSSGGGGGGVQSEHEEKSEKCSTITSSSSGSIGSSSDLDPEIQRAMTTASPESDVVPFTARNGTVGGIINNTQLQHRNRWAASPPTPPILNGSDKCSHLFSAEQSNLDRRLAFARNEEVRSSREMATTASVKPFYSYPGQTSQPSSTVNGYARANGSLRNADWYERRKSYGFESALGNKTSADDERKRDCDEIIDSRRHSTGSFLTSELHNKTKKYRVSTAAADDPAERFVRNRPSAGATLKGSRTIVTLGDGGCDSNKSRSASDLLQAMQSEEESEVNDGTAGWRRASKLRRSLRENNNSGQTAVHTSQHPFEAREEKLREVERTFLSCSLLPTATSFSNKVARNPVIISIPIRHEDESGSKKGNSISIKGDKSEKSLKNGETENGVGSVPVYHSKTWINCDDKLSDVIPSASGLQKRPKKVEFSKMEVHFSAESGRLNIVETDENKPPSNLVRRRRKDKELGREKEPTDDATTPSDNSGNNDSTQQMRFGDSEYEKWLLVQNDRSEDFTNSSTTNTTEKTSLYTAPQKQETHQRPSTTLVSSTKDEETSYRSAENVVKKAEEPAVPEDKITKTWGVSLKRSPLVESDHSSVLKEPYWKSSVKLKPLPDKAKSITVIEKEAAAPEGEMKLQQLVRSLRPTGSPLLQSSSISTRNNVSNTTTTAKTEPIVQRSSLERESHLRRVESDVTDNSSVHHSPKMSHTRPSLADWENETRQRLTDVRSTFSSHIRDEAPSVPPKPLRSKTSSDRTEFHSRLYTRGLYTASDDELERKRDRKRGCISSKEDSNFYLKPEPSLALTLKDLKGRSWLQKPGLTTPPSPPPLPSLYQSQHNTRTSASNEDIRSSHQQKSLVLRLRDRLLEHTMPQQSSSGSKTDWIYVNPGELELEPKRKISNTTIPIQQERVESSFFSERIPDVAKDTNFAIPKRQPKLKMDKVFSGILNVEESNTESTKISAKTERIKSEPIVNSEDESTKAANYILEAIAGYSDCSSSQEPNFDDSAREKRKKSRIHSSKTKGQITPAVKLPRSVRKPSSKDSAGDNSERQPVKSHHHHHHARTVASEKTSSAESVVKKASKSSKPVIEHKAVVATIDQVQAGSTNAGNAKGHSSSSRRARHTAQTHSSAQKIRPPAIKTTKNKADLSHSSSDRSMNSSLASTPSGSLTRSGGRRFQKICENYSESKSGQNHLPQIKDEEETETPASTVASAVPKSGHHYVVRNRTAAVGNKRISSSKGEKTAAASSANADARPRKTVKQIAQKKYEFKAGTALLDMSSVPSNSKSKHVTRDREASRRHHKSNIVHV